MYEVAQALADSRHGSWRGGWDHVSGAALARWLRLHGKLGVTLVWDDYTPVEASTDREERIYGVAWAGADMDDPDTAVRYGLESYRAWAAGEGFGWRLIDPSGEEVSSCYGHYDVPGEREYTFSEAVSEAQADAQRRVNV